MQAQVDLPLHRSQVQQSCWCIDGQNNNAVDRSSRLGDIRNFGVVQGNTLKYRIVLETITLWHQHIRWLQQLEILRAGHSNWQNVTGPMLSLLCGDVKRKEAEEAEREREEDEQKEDAAHGKKMKSPLMSRMAIKLVILTRRSSLAGHITPTRVMKSMRMLNKAQPILIKRHVRSGSSAG